MIAAAYSASAATPSDNYSPYYSPEETTSSSVSDDTDYYNPSTSSDGEDSYYLDSSLDDNGEDIDVYDDPGFLSFVERGRSSSSFKRFRGNGCRKRGGSQGRNGREYQLHRRTSRSQCEKKCLDFGSRCTGYEYDSIQRNCEVWRVNIDPSQTRRANVRGLDCYIKEEKKNDDQCFRNSSPRVNRNRQRFQFELEDSRDSKCVDRHRQFYEYGQFQGVDSFDSCARACVNNVNSSLLRHFQGIDFNCEAKACNCLYDSGTLNNRNSRRFDRTVTRFNGVGRVQNTRFAEGFACGSVNLIANRRGWSSRGGRVKSRKTMY